MVKVIYQEPQTESLYECDRVHIERFKTGLVRFELERGFSEVSGEVNRPLRMSGTGFISLAINGDERISVYIMNDQGKTVEHYSFGPDEAAEDSTK